MTNTSGEITVILGRVAAGDESAKSRLFEAAYGELRKLAEGLMRGERRDHTLQPTALVNEASARMLGSDQALPVESRRLFFWVMSRAMRQVLVDHARRKGAGRRGGDQTALALDETIAQMEQRHDIRLTALHDSLEELEALNARQARIVEMRFFGGFDMREIADQLEVSLSTVEKEWRVARAWLQTQLRGDPS